MFSGASNFAEGVDKAFVFIFSIAFFFILGITIFMIYTVIRFNRKKGNPARQFDGSITLELIWTIVPLAIVLAMFFIGLKGFTPMRKPPKDAMVITAIGRMWEWEFDYGNNMKSRDLVIPINKPVRLNLHSEDVNHSLFIPGFRVKEDVIPGYNNFLWFIPTIEGEYEILCTEYCGLLHSGMLAKAKVVKQDVYEQWFSELNATANKPLPEGFLMLQSTGCLACHSIDGTKLVGPTFKGLFGIERNVSEGNNSITITADEIYIKKSIYEPDSQIVTGFSKGLMKSYRELLTEENLKLITEYIKTLATGN
jgi:cytochrome c oxidase subunit II